MYEIISLPSFKKQYINCVNVIYVKRREKIVLKNTICRIYKHIYIERERERERERESGRVSKKIRTYIAICT